MLVGEVEQGPVESPSLGVCLERFESPAVLSLVLKGIP